MNLARLTSASADVAGTYTELATTTSGRGSGATLTLVSDGSTITTVTVVSGGSGYAAGDTVSMGISFNGSKISSASYTLTLTAAEVPAFTLVNSSVPASATCLMD